MANDKSKIEETVAEVAVGSTTTATPAKADTTSNPIPNDAKPNDPPVRTNRPDVPIAQTLAAGAGAHEARELDHEVDGEPTDADGFDRFGRYIGEAKKSK